MKKILFELRSAINIKKKYFLFDQKKLRIKQYIKGLVSLKKIIIILNMLILFTLITLSKIQNIFLNK